MKISMVVISKDGDKRKVILTAANEYDLVDVEVLVNTNSQAFTLARQLFEAEVQTFDEIPEIEMKIEPSWKKENAKCSAELTSSKPMPTMSEVIRNFHKFPYGPSHLNLKVSRE